MLDGGRRSHLLVVVWALLTGVPHTSSAQIPGVASPASPPPAAHEPLGRDTPFGTITGFSNAVHHKEFAVAASYLQTDERRPQQLENLAHDLSDLLDRYWTQSFTSLSKEPDGELADGLEANRERIPLTIGDQSVDLHLTRVTDPKGVQVWLFSADSLASVPRLHRSPAATWVERVMPASLVASSLRGISLAQWILWATSFLAPLALFWMISVVVTWLARRHIADVTRRTLFISGWNRVHWLVIAALTLLTHLAALPLLGFSITFRYAYARVVLFGGILVAALLVWQLVSVTFRQARLMAIRRGRSDTRSLIQLGERVVKVLVVMIAVFGLLALGGVNPTTALAGVGIIGVAAALGAQKSVENLLGGVFLLTDKVLAVGDYCRLSDREGWVEDVTLRSVRLRTLEQTLLSVPAGMLAQGSIENFSTRNKILLLTVLRLRYGTTGDQLQAVLDGVRRLLAKHRSIDRETARIRLIGFGAQAIELELFAYITTAEHPLFLEVRESLLLQVAQIVESSGSAFAVPTQFIHVQSEAGDRLPDTTPAEMRH